MARIRRKIRGEVRDAAEGPAAPPLFADVAVLELDGGILLVGRAADYPDATPLPGSRTLVQVAEIAGARLSPGRTVETYSDLDGNVYSVTKPPGRPFCCGSPFRSLGATVRLAEISG